MYILLCCRTLYIKLVSKHIEIPIEVGILISITDGVAKVVGIESLTSGELVEFSEIYGLSLNLNESTSDSATLGSDDSIFEGDVAERTETELFVQAGEEQIGEILDALGNDLLS